MSDFGKAEVKAEGQLIEQWGIPVPKAKPCAYDELMAYLEPGEVVEAIVFGAFGWGSWDDDDEGSNSMGYHEDMLKEFIPWDKRGKVLTLEEARPHMQCWSFDGGFGAPECYATYVWTNQRVIWVTQYDGSTGLDSMPRNPVACVPSMPGG